MILLISSTAIAWFSGSTSTSTSTVEQEQTVEQSNEHTQEGTTVVADGEDGEDGESEEGSTIIIVSGTDDDDEPVPDPDPPMTTDDYSDDRWESSPQNINIWCTSGDCHQIEWRVDGGSIQTSPGDETTATVGEDSDGSLQLEYRGIVVEDGVYAEESWNSQRVRVDTSSPSANIVSPSSNDWVNNDITVSVNYDGPGPSDTTCSYMIEDTGTTVESRTVSCGTSEIQIDVPSDCSTEGENTCRLTVSAEDQAGNSDSDTANYNIDLTPPETTDDYEHGDEWQNTEQTVNFDCTDYPGNDNAGCAYTEYCVDQDNTCTPNMQGSSVTVDEDGTNYVRYRSTDNAGNTENINERMVRVDTQPPRAEIHQPDGAMWQNVTFDVAVEYEDPGPSETTCMYTIEDAGTTVREETVSCGTESLIVEVPETCEEQGEDRCQVTVSAEDEAGNTDLETVNYNIDYTPPEISCTDCIMPPNVIVENEVTFEPDVTDPYSGVDTVQICRGEDCTDPYCSYDATYAYSCEYETSYPYGPRDVCIEATDVAGNTDVNCDPDPFVVQGGLGDPCHNDFECFIGECDDGMCHLDALVPPGIHIR